MKLVSLMKKMGSGMGLKNMGIGESRFLKSIRECFDFFRRLNIQLTHEFLRYFSNLELVFFTQFAA